MKKENEAFLPTQIECIMKTESVLILQEILNFNSCKHEQFYCFYIEQTLFS